LIKAGSVERVLFLVDRGVLGKLWKPFRSITAATGPPGVVRQQITACLLQTMTGRYQILPAAILMWLWLMSVTAHLLVGFGESSDSLGCAAHRFDCDPTGAH